MTYAAIVDGMDKKERQAFDRDLYRDEPRARGGRVSVPRNDDAEMLALASIFRLPAAPGA